MSRIVFVDDEADICSLLKTVFIDAGFDSVLFFESGTKFIDYYGRQEVEPPDLVFLDIQMPGMSGLEVLERALQDRYFEQTIFVSFSAYMQDADSKWLGYIGFDAQLSKPVGMKEILRTIQELIEKKEAILSRRNPYGNLVAAVHELTEMRLRAAVLERNYIKRLISPEVFETLDTDPDKLKPRFSQVAVGFVDIRGFTQLMNRVEIGQIDEILKLFFELAYDCVSKHGGHLDKFIGDEVMWFHEGEDICEESRHCLQVASDIVSKGRQLNQSIQKKLHQRIPVSVGLGAACGTCAVGIFGAPKNRIQYSVLGPAVNLASRLCSEARPSELLIGGSIIEHCDHNTRKIGFRSIRGFDHDVELRRVVIPRGKKKEKKDT